MTTGLTGVNHNFSLVTPSRKFYDHQDDSDIWNGIPVSALSGNLRSQMPGLPKKMLEGRTHHCGFCLKEFGKAKHVQLHIANTPKCRTTRDREIDHRSASPLVDTGSSDPNPLGLDPMADNMDEFVGHDYFPSERINEEVVKTNKRDRSQSRHTTADTPRAASERYAEDYNTADVAHILRKSQTAFEILKESQNGLGEKPWVPFKDKDEWELAQFLITEVSQTATDKYLKLPIVSRGLT